METKKTEKIKSKTPVRSVISHLIEESSSQEDYSDENNSNGKYNEPTDYSPEPKPYNDDWTHEQESIMYLKYEIQSKQKLIEDLTETRENLKHTLNKFKAQNKELTFQLKDYKEKNFELEKEIFLMREKLIIREKEAQRLFIENESLKRQQAMFKKESHIKSHR